MPRRSLLVVATTLVLAGSFAATAAPATAGPAGWEGPAPVESSTTQAQDPTGVASALGAIVVWHHDGRAYVARRDPGPGSSWSAPLELPGSSGRRAGSPASPILLETLPSGGALVLAERRRTAGGSSRAWWRISPQGTPSPARGFPFDQVTPSMLSVADGRWLVTGTTTGYSGRAFVAVRQPGGRWELSAPFPVHRAVNPVVSYLDPRGAPHLLAVAADPHIPGSDLRRGAYPMYEATLRPDRSWGPRHQAVRTFGPNAVGDAGAAGDVAIAYRHEDQQARVSTFVRTRRAGSEQWSPRVRVPELYPGVDVAVAGDASTAVLRSTGPAGLRFGRLDPSGALDQWQRLASARRTSGDPVISLSAGGSATVSADVSTLDPDGVRVQRQRTWRCLPGTACEQIGDFAAAWSTQPVLASSPDGQAYRWSTSAADCAGASLCAWWHDAAPSSPHG